MSVSPLSSEVEFASLPSASSAEGEAAAADTAAGAEQSSPRGTCELDPLSSAPHSEEEDLGEKWRDAAYNQLQEKPEWRKRDIQELRNMVTAERSLTCPTDDAFLLKFLRAQKFDYDRSFDMLKRYFLMRRTSAKNFEKAMPSLCREVFAKQHQTVLAHRDPIDRRVFLFRAGIWDPVQVSQEDLFSSNYICLELMAREPKTQIAGIVAVVDMSHFAFTHIMHITPEYIRSVAHVIQNSFPLRFREIHIIHESYLFDIAFAIIKPFLSEAIRSRIQCHGDDLSRLHTTLPPEILPEEFGGRAGPMNNQEVVDVSLELEQFFSDLQGYGFSEDYSVAELSEEVEHHHPFQGYCMSDQAPN